VSLASFATATHFCKTATRFAALFLAALYLLGAAPAGAAETEPKAPQALGARVEDRGHTAKLVFELTQKIDAAAFPVARPDRIIVDLPELGFRIDPATLSPAGKAQALIKSFRFGQFAPGKSRIVIDLSRPARVEKAASVDAPTGPRLEIDLSETDAASFAAAAEAARAHLAAAPTPNAPAAPAPGDKPLLVIDPGHGGVDIGASGKHGEMEKHIVMDFARALRARLESRGQVKVAFTRDDDVFIPLEERVRIARSHNASLFLSIHADTLGEASVEGATVYTVSAKASDAEAARIAEKENRADLSAGVQRPADQEDVGDILLDLTRRETKAFSRQFAEALIGRWRDAGNLNKNPSRSAGFVVLKAHDVPSVLLELGYLSSDADLARLTSPQWRERAADATASAIETYFAAQEKILRGPAQAVAASPARPQ
jgi:N-acetylmuramoyl-L-alanine amidase